MENNKKIVRISHVTTLILIGLSFGAAGWIYYSIFLSNSDTAVLDGGAAIGIDKELYGEIKSEEAYGTTVSVEEPGYGRVNPFSNYKAESVETDETEDEANTESDSE